MRYREDLDADGMGEKEETCKSRGRGTCNQDILREKKSAFNKI